LEKKNAQIWFLFMRCDPVINKVQSITKVRAATASTTTARISYVRPESIAIIKPMTGQRNKATGIERIRMDGKDGDWKTELTGWKLRFDYRIKSWDTSSAAARIMKYDLHKQSDMFKWWPRSYTRVPRQSTRLAKGTRGERKK
jgi:hypothetical protein